MSYSQLIEICKSGKTGMIPGWQGYIDWDFSKNEIYFHNGNYRLCQKELEDYIKNRTDLFYII